MANNVFKDGDFYQIIEKRYKFIQDVYLRDNKPWVIGYSGGKDSTVIADLVIESIKRLHKNKRHKKIFLISSDTMVENPMIEDYIHKNIKMIDEYTKKEGLPISATLIKPLLEDSFWVGLIGKGYPAPQQKFRWCTDRLKIKPANAFVKKQVDKYGEVVMILGVRYDESLSRNIIMDKHKVEGKVLRKHTTLNNALVFTPIEDFSTDDVWKYLLTKNPNGWQGDNEFLMSLYQDSSEGECPLMVDKSKPSCGNSRFGCWTCTVVVQDKSLNGFIQTAKKGRDKETIKKLTPLAQLRNWLKDNRNNNELREHKRQNGTLYKVQTKEGFKTGLGPYNFEGRKKILKKLLKAQVESGLELITEEELKLIQKEWSNRLGDLSNSVNNVYKEVYGKNIFAEKQAMTYLNEDLDLLRSICIKEGVSIELIRRLLKVEQKYYGYQYRSGLYRDIENILNEEWVHEDVISSIKFGDIDDN